MRVGPQPPDGDPGWDEGADGRPAPALAGRVLAYTGHRQRIPAPVRRRETPAGELILIIGFDDPYRAQATPDAAGLSTFRSFLAGFHDRPILTGHDGRQCGVQVRLDPLGAALGPDQARPRRGPGRLVRHGPRTGAGLSTKAVRRRAPLPG